MQKLHAELRAAASETQLPEAEEREAEEHEAGDSEAEDRQVSPTNRLLGQTPVARLQVSGDAAFKAAHPCLAQLNFSIRLILHLLGGGCQDSHINQMPELDTDTLELRAGE